MIVMDGNAVAAKCKAVAAEEAKKLKHQPGLAVVLVGDEGFVHVGWKGRLVAGATAGAVTVWLRQRYGVDGSALGLLLAGALTPVLHVSYHGLCRFIRFLREKFAKSEN